MAESQDPEDLVRLRRYRREVRVDHLHRFGVQIPSWRSQSKG